MITMELKKPEKKNPENDDFLDSTNTETILIIEDEVDIRSFVARVLELEGYQVLETGDGSTGMQMLRENHVSLVLLDLRLPGPDGWSILREIKRDPVFSTTPVVVFTAIAESIQRRKTLRMGASSYLVKPLSSHLLSETISGILHDISNNDTLTKKSTIDSN